MYLEIFISRTLKLQLHIKESSHQIANIFFNYNFSLQIILSFKDQIIILKSSFIK